MEKGKPMRAILEDIHGEPDVLRITEQPRPEPAPGQVLIRVAAAGVNRADAMQRQGMYPPPPGESSIYGLEVAGTIIGLGEGVPAHLAGQDVVALLAGGGYAEYVVVDARHTLPIPAGVSMPEAAGLIEVAATVYSNLVLTCGISERPEENRGKTMLIHGATGGIGSHAIQFARALGLRVFATAGSDDKCDYARALGAEPINYRTEDFRTRLLESTGGRGADVILDVVGGSYLEANIKTLAVDGHLVTIGLQGGAKGTLNLGYMLPRRLSVHTTSLRSRTADDKAHILTGVQRATWPLIESGTITPNLYRALPLEQAPEAHRILDSGEHRGKIVLVP